jgi:hypothetical protein
VGEASDAIDAVEHIDAASASGYSHSSSPAVYLLYLSTSLLWRQAVADIRGVTASHTLRNNARCTWRRSTGLQNVSYAAIRRALSLLRLCGSVTAEAHG